jgi:aryl-alcohol dehydrogenase-like predicted oxidoreductase
MQRAEQVPSGQLSADTVRAERKRLDLLQFEADASQSGRSRTELALEYVLKRSETSVALVGMHRESHLSATLEALDSPLLVRPTAFSG